jgi:hypothetical protein
MEAIGAEWEHDFMGSGMVAKNLRSGDKHFLGHRFRGFNHNSQHRENIASEAARQGVGRRSLNDFFFTPAAASVMDSLGTL